MLAARLGLMSLCVLTTGLSAETPVIVMDDQLVRHELTLDRVDDGVVQFVESTDDLSVLALIFRANSALPDRISPPGMAKTVDGRTWSGAISTRPSDDPELLAWAHPVFGRQLLPLESLAVVTLPGAQPTALAPQEEDTVIFVNGDVASGYIAGISDTLTLESSAGERDIPMSLVAQFSLVNDIVTPRGPRLFLDDGSIVDATGFTYTEAQSRLQITSDGSNQSESGIFRESMMLAFLPDAERLAPLHALELLSSRSLGTGLVRRTPETVKTPSPIGLQDLLLPGAMVATWKLQEGSARFSTVAELSAGPLGWGACVVIFEADGEELHRVSLDEAKPASAVAFDLAQDAERLSLRIEPGPFGPIRTRVLLREPVLRIDP